MNGEIYMLILPGDRKYVGLTTQWARRMNQHAQGMVMGKESNQLVDREIAKCGWENVTVIKLATAIKTRDELHAAERGYIDAWGTCGDGGLNRHAGGAVMKRKSMPSPPYDHAAWRRREERKSANLSAAARRRFDDPEWKAAWQVRHAAGVARHHAQRAGVACTEN